MILDAMTGCQRILTVVYLVKTIMSIICILVPIILIVMLSIDFVKMMISSGSDEDGRKRILKMVVHRVVLAVIIFIAPTIIWSFYGIIVVDKKYDGKTCFDFATSSTVEVAQKLLADEEAAKKLQAEQEAEAKRQQALQEAEEKKQQQQNAIQNSVNAGALAGSVGLSSALGYSVPMGTASGTHSCSRGWRDDHGVDLLYSSGTPVYPAKEGTVNMAGWQDSYGNFVKILHSDGYYTLYAHMLQTPSVHVGEEVTKTTLLGYSDNTGDSTGPHLHLEFRRSDQNRLNPACFLDYSQLDGDCGITTCNWDDLIS